MINRLFLTLCLLCTFLVSFGATAQESDSSAVPVITVGIPHLPPQKESSGVSIEAFELKNYIQGFWEEWGNLNHVNVEFRHESSDELYNMLLSRELDFVAMTTLNHELIPVVAYSIPFVETRAELYRRVSGQTSSNGIILDLPPQVMPTCFINNLDVLLHLNDIDRAAYHLSDAQYLFTWSPVAAEKAMSHHRFNERFVKEDNDYSVKFRVMGLGDKKADLIAINQYIRSYRPSSTLSDFTHFLKDSERFTSLVNSYSQRVTTEMEAKIVETPLLNFASISEGEEPYFVQEGPILSGYIPDVLEQLSKQLGVEFRARSYPSFQEALEAVYTNEIDLFPGIYQTEHRDRKLVFTQGIDRSAIAIAGEKHYYALSELEGLRLALVRGLYENELVSSLLPTNPIIYLDTAEEAINTVARGEADAFVGKLLTSAYIINTEDLHTLKLHTARDIDEHFIPKLALSKLNSDWLDILNVAIGDVTEQEFRDLKTNWKRHIILSQDEAQIKAIHNKIVLAGLVILLAVLAALIFYRAQIKKRKQAQLTLESALKEAKDAKLEAEQMTLAKSDFLARMSHEIRTPMNGVLGMAEALSFTRLDTEQKDLLNTLNGSARNLMALLNDVLDFSKMDAGKLTLESVSCDLGLMLNHVTSNFKHKANSKGLSLNCRVDSAITNSYLCDSTRLMQVLNNLVSNSVKFTESGFVELSAQLVVAGVNVETEHEVSCDLLVFQVRDSGIGIESDKLADLFDPFVQADGDITRRFGGTGLGLSICKEIIDEMGGDIRVSSVVGSGSQFRITIALPVEKPLLDANARAQEGLLNEFVSGAQLNEIKVLFAEDNVVNQKVIGGQLQRLGVDFKVVDNGLAALELFRENPHFDIVLSDCHMPEMDGFTLASTLKEEFGEHCPYLIALTADALSGAAQRCREAGFDDYISKPCPIDILESKLVLGGANKNKSNPDFRFEGDDLQHWINEQTQALESNERREGYLEQDTQEADSIDPLSWMNDLELAQESGSLHSGQDIADLGGFDWQTIDSSSLESSSEPITLPEYSAFTPESVLTLSGGEIEIAQGILQTFIDNYQSDIDELMLVCAEQDTSKITDTTHRIKGTALYVGSQPVADVAKLMEEDAKAGSVNDIERRCMYVVEGLELLAQEVNDYLANARSFNE